MIRLAFPAFGPEELAAIAEVLESGQLTMGPKVAEFEAEIARACGVEHAVAVSSGTAALHLAILALGIGEDDEVVVPAYTFPATANVVALAGARVVLVDVDPTTMNVDVEQVAALITPRTRAVMAVHLFGRPVDWDALRDVVPDEVPIVEDAAGALGARSRGRPCGSLGVVGCLSFHPRKIVTTGEGGAITTDDGDLAAALRSLRHHGIRSAPEFEIAAPGFNYRLPDVLCALGIPQLQRLDALLDERRALAAAYAGRLDTTVELPEAGQGDEHGWQAYVVRTPNRDAALEHLRAAGIEAQIGTYALHRLAAYRDGGAFPGADECADTALALPFHSRLTDDDVARVCASLAEVV